MSDRKCCHTQGPESSVITSKLPTSMARELSMVLLWRQKLQKHWPLHNWRRLMSANSLQFQSSSNATLSEPSHENQTANDGDLRAFLMPVTSSSPILAIYTEYSLDADNNTGNFAEASGLMVGDEVNLFFHYFPHVVNAAIQCLSAPSLGSCFSRLLLSDYHSIPRCAAFVVLAHID